jgi:cytochrome c oxidase subunit II
MKKLLSLLAFFSLIGPAYAQEHADSLHETLAAPWQLGFSPPATPVMEQLYRLHDQFLLIIITAICVFVLAFMLYICVRFRRSKHPVPSKTAHNTQLEVLWTVIPILILVVIAIPSLRAHYYMQDAVNPDMTIKVTGYQWYWHYDYPDHGGFGFDSYMKKKEDLKEGDHRLLAVDNQLVVPVDTKVQVLVTAADVIHAWTVPVFGIKRDAVPGRLNEMWFTATKTGRFYGQCSELCGVGHGFMPIVVDVVSKDEFNSWVKTKQQEAGVSPSAPSATDQKATTPVTQPVPTRKDPMPVIEKEKSMSKPGASDNDPGRQKQENDTHVGKDNQPRPGEAADAVPGDADEQ